MLEESEPSLSYCSYFEAAASQFQSGKIEECCAILDAILRADPLRLDALLFLAECHQLSGRRYAEIACLDRFLSFVPDDIAATLRLADAYAETGLIGRAVDTIEQIDWDSINDSNVIYQAASVLRSIKQYDLSLPLYDRSIELDAENQSARFEKSLTHLSRKEFLLGWRDFDYRHHFTDGFTVPESARPWDGRPFSGRRLIVLNDGGFGDTIWASRFLPAVKELGGNVTLQIHSRLCELFDGIDGIDDLVDTSLPFGAYDYYVPELSLPKILNVVEPKQHPPTSFHNRCPGMGIPDAVDSFGGNRFRVGIIWSGSDLYGNNRHRSAEFQDFEPLLAQRDTQFFSLQKGRPAEMLAGSGVGDLVLQVDDNDFLEAATVIEAMDLIIMTDSAIAHLAGSMGKPVWLLVDYCPYWYFAGESSESDWYSSIRVFRQDDRNDWRPVIREICTLLSETVQQWKLSER